VQIIERGEADCDYYYNAMSPFRTVSRPTERALKPILAVARRVPVRQAQGRIRPAAREVVGWVLRTHAAL